MIEFNLVDRVSHGMLKKDERILHRVEKILNLDVMGGGGVLHCRSIAGLVSHKTEQYCFD
jgi:predicted nucleic acid-binding protein